MKRQSGEFRYDYCARRIMDQEETKAKLAPRLVHCSVALVPHPGEQYKDIPEAHRPLVRVKVKGTYRKPVEEVKE